MAVPDPGQGERAAILRVGRREDRSTRRRAVVPRSVVRSIGEARERNRRTGWPRDFPGTWASVPFHADYIV